MVSATKEDEHDGRAKAYIEYKVTATAMLAPSLLVLWASTHPR